jgi:hypothetical protein
MKTVAPLNERLHHAHDLGAFSYIADGVEVVDLGVAVGRTGWAMGSAF